MDLVLVLFSYTIHILSLRLWYNTHEEISIFLGVTYSKLEEVRAVSRGWVVSYTQVTVEVMRTEVSGQNKRKKKAKNYMPQTPML